MDSCSIRRHIQEFVFVDSGFQAIPGVTQSSAWFASVPNLPPLLGDETMTVWGLGGRQVG